MMVGIAVLFLCLLVVAYFIHAGFKYTRMISHIFLSLVYRPVVENYSSSLGERVTILDSSDHEIEAIFVEKPGSKKLVIFCHESGASKESWEKYAYFFPLLGFHVLSVDLGNRSMEPDTNSLTQWPTEGDMERVLTAVRWAKRAVGSDLTITLFGVSKGADVAFAAAFQDAAVAAVIADGLFSMKEIFRDYIRKWGPILVKPNLFGEKYPDLVVNIFADLGFWYSQKKSRSRFVDVEKLLKRPHAPLLVIHGQEDDYVPETHQKFLEKVAAAGEKFDHLVVPEAPHNQAIVFGRELYEKNIRNFVERVYGS